MSDLAPDTTLVVAGINHGINLGDDIAYSGTVGAAIEAVLLGWPGVAVSQQGDDDTVGLVERGAHRFGLAPVAAAIIAAISRRPTTNGPVLNVNLPSRIDAAEPVRITRSGRRRYERGWLKPRPATDGDDTQRFRPYGGLAGDPPRHETGSDVDFTAVLAGRISITPLTFSQEAAAADHDAWLAGLDLPRVVTETLAGTAASPTPTPVRAG